MNRVIRGLLALALISSLAAYGATTKNGGSCCTTSCDSCSDCNNCCLGPCDGYPFLQIRSQGRNSARQLVGVQQFVNRYDMECTNGMFSIALEYTRSFREKRIANFYFGKDLVNCCELFVQGSRVENRNSKAWLADNFGLPTDYDSRVKFCPRIQNVIVDLDFYLGLDEAAEGLYLRFNAPIVWTKWELCPCERSVSTGELGFDEGYMAETAVARTDLPANFLQSMCGGVTWGDMKTPMCYGRIYNCDCTKTRLAELDMTLGWNFRLEEDDNFGIFLYVAAPVGNKPCAKYLFEPMVGNGKHWELGGGISGEWIFWRSEECEERYMGLWMTATIAHLFKTCQCRSFDFCNKPNSRYMLLAEMEKNDTDPKINDTGLTATATNATYKYKKNLIPAINWSTFNVDVRIDVQADVALKLGWVRDNWSFDLGYNLYARTGEKFCNDCCNDCCDCNDCCNDCCGCNDNCGCGNSGTYVIKGDAWVYGLNDNESPEAWRPMSASQSLATIYAGKNYPTLTTDTATTGPTTNPRVDNPKAAYYGASTTATDHDLKDAGGDAINTSIQPIFATKSLLNLGKSPSMITHKLFLNFSYAWKDREECEDWVPFLGIGGEVEFAQDTDCCCDDCCNSCCSTSCGCNDNCGCGDCCNSCCDDCCDSRRGGISQWGIWIKGGVSFD